MPNSLLEKAKNEKMMYAMKNPIANKSGFYLPSGDTTRHNSEEELAKAAAAKALAGSECIVVSMFYNLEKGLLVYDSYPRGEIYSKLISVKIPSHFFVTKVSFQFIRVLSYN